MKNLTLKPSLILFLISGILILIGLIDFKMGNFNYWIISHSIYGVGVILFWFNK